MKYFINTLFFLLFSSILLGQRISQLTFKEKLERKFAVKILEDSLYGRGKLFSQGNIMVGGNLGYSVIIGTPGITNFLGIRMSPIVTYFPVKRFGIGLIPALYSSWSNHFPPRYYWDFGIHSRYYLLNHRSITLYPFIIYQSGNFDYYNEYELNIKRNTIYHKLKTGVGLNVRLKNSISMNADIGWWHFLTRPPDVEIGTFLLEIGVTYTFKSRR